MTVGLKLLLGVTLASNTCIAALLFLNHEASQRLTTMMAEVVHLRDDIDADLRGSIVQLQQQFMQLPQMLTSNPTQEIVQEVEGSFPITQRQQLQKREEYNGLYTRTEKRDIANGKPVVTIRDNQLLLTRGLFDAQGVFTEAIEQLLIASTQPEADRERLHTLIAESLSRSGSVEFYEQKIGALRALVADKSLEAERSRTQILGYVEQINLQQQRMERAVQQQQYHSLAAGLAAVLINILSIFLLTRIIVERPLSRLTTLVEALGAGQFPEIPWRSRRDQIGVLCAAIDRFRTALLRLHQEEQRKQENQHHIQQLVYTMTATIHGLNNQSAEMARAALSLQELAGTAEAVSSDVAALAEDTARRTVEVGNSSQQIDAAVGDIHRELAVQNGEVCRFVEAIGQARQQLGELRRSVAEIDTIVGTVRAITEQTKILALNATIEAVKAKEFGRGFAVVANEVKKLSQDTASATGDVQEKIETINKTCQAFIISFDSIDHGIAALQQVTHTIEHTVARQRTLTRTIVNQSCATGDNTREVSLRIAEMTKAAGTVFSLSQETRQHAEAIATQLGHLLTGSVNDLGAMCRGGEAESHTACSATNATAMQQPETTTPCK